MLQKLDLSFVIPVKNESESVDTLVHEIIDGAEKRKKKYEIIFIDDGSTDNTFEILKKLNHNNKNIKVLQLRGNFGKSTALQIGFDNTHGKIIFTMDGDLQDNPKEIPAFLAKLDEGYDLVSGWKKTRHDPISKVIPSRILNFATYKLTGIKLHDINCGFKAYRRDVISDLNLYGELYSFIPIFAAKQNYKVGEIVVEHRERKHGKSKFGWERNIKGFLDLLTTVFLTGYLKRPGHFFGTFGLVSFTLGFLIGIYIAYLRITTGSIQFRHPLLYLGMLLMIIGIQLISTGLIAEMVIYSKGKFDYSSNIKETI